MSEDKNPLIEPTVERVVKLISSVGLKTSDLFSDTYLDEPKDPDAQWFDRVHVCYLHGPAIVPVLTRQGEPQNWMIVLSTESETTLDEDYWRQVFVLLDAETPPDHFKGADGSWTSDDFIDAGERFRTELYPESYGESQGLDMPEAESGPGL